MRHSLDVYDIYEYLFRGHNPKCSLDYANKKATLLLLLDMQSVVVVVPLAAPLWCGH